MQDQTTISPFSLLDHEVAKWIIGKINKLEDSRAKFCSYNAVRFLRWAKEIFKTSHIVSSFCALNATEEAVAAFISAAKAHGHKDHAKHVNLHDHKSKALVSVFAQRCTHIAKQGKLAFALHPGQDCLAFRVPDENSYRYGSMHLSAFRIHPNTKQDVNGDIQLGDMPLLEELEEEITKAAELRNMLLYATDAGYQTGFNEPEACLVRETQLSLGLIWATIDMYMYPSQDRPFVEEILRRMASFSKNHRKKN